MSLLIAAFLLHESTAEASPARKSEIRLEQPDGSSFRARLSGDEFMKMLTTEDGEAIIQDRDGWYCYARFDSGRKVSSRYRIGEDAPAEVIAESRAIPMQEIAHIAAASRACAPQAGGTPLKGRLAPGQAMHGLVLLVQFQDLKFSYAKSDFEALLNRGRDGRPGAMDYFNDQFGGLYDFSFDVSDIITLDRGYRYYGENDAGNAGKDLRAAEMVLEACRKADRKTDFSIYDDDRDGCADNVFIIYAGPDEAEGAGEYHVWSHSWYLSQAGVRELVLDGVRIDRYACTSELFDGVITGIGTFCHEYSHTFGLPDMYDTDYMNSGGLAEGLWGSTSLMDKGNRNDNGNTPPNFNAIEREILGISESIAIAGEGRYELTPVNSGGTCYRIDSSVSGEYYLLECRGNGGWDRHIGGEGLLVYHIDKSGNDAGYGMTAYGRWQKEANSVNCNPSHQCADLIEAVMPAAGPGTGGTTDISRIFFPSGDTDSISPDSEHMFTFWNGEQSIFSIRDITRTEAGISFTVSMTGESLLPSPVVTGKDIFQDAAIISWSVSAGFGGQAHIKWGEENSGDMEECEVRPYSSSNDAVRYAIVLEGLKPRTRYNVKISCREDGTEGNSVDAGFMTKAPVEKGRPYIYLRYTQRNDDGSFPPGTGLPLRLFNATDAEKIEWTYNGKVIFPGNDGYYVPAASGILKARAFYEDGRQEVMTKEIIIRDNSR